MTAIISAKASCLSLSKVSFLFHSESKSFSVKYLLEYVNSNCLKIKSVSM